jgi:hypothetical protein
MTTRDAVRLTSPVVAYSARNNLQAHILAAQLNDAGIAASVVEDTSTAGMTALGLVENIHNPQVFVEQTQLSTACEMLRQLSSSGGSRPEVEEFCYHCGAEIPASGEACAACGASLENEVVKEQPASYESSVGSSMNDYFRRSRKWFAILNIIPVLGMLVVSVIGFVLMLINAMLRLW